jgi:hypothetical protein
MVWRSVLPEEDAEAEFDNGGFQTVRSGNSKRKKRKPEDDCQPIVPPDTPLDTVVLAFEAFQPTALASHLDTPVTLLPRHSLGARASPRTDLSSPRSSGEGSLLHSASPATLSAPHSTRTSVKRPPCPMSWTSSHTLSTRSSATLTQWPREKSTG